VLPGLVPSGGREEPASRRSGVPAAIFPAGEIGPGTGLLQRGQSFSGRRFYVSMQAQHPDVQRKRTGNNGGSTAVVLIARLLYLNAAIVPP